MKLQDYNLCSGAAATIDGLTNEQINMIEPIIKGYYPNGMDESSLNYFLKFERNRLAEWLGFENWEDLQDSDNYGKYFAAQRAITRVTNLFII